MQNALDLRLFAKNSYIDANFADEWNGISLGIQHHYLIDANTRMAAAVFGVASACTKINSLFVILEWFGGISYFISGSGVA